MGIFDIFETDPARPPRKLNTDKYSRWRLILKTTNSGRTQFVCLICGRMTDNPGACQRPEQIPKVLTNDLDESQRPARSMRSCVVIEQEVNKNIKAYTKYAAMRLDMIMSESTCPECHGWGCGVCHGTGDRLFSPVIDGVSLV